MYLPKRQHPFGQNKIEMYHQSWSTLLQFSTLKTHFKVIARHFSVQNAVLKIILYLMFVFDVSDHRCWSLCWSMFGSHQRKMSSLVNTSTSLHFQGSIRISSLYHVNHMILRREVWSHDTCYISMCQNTWRWDIKNDYSCRYWWVIQLFVIFPQDKQPRWVWVENKALRSPHQEEAKAMLPRIHQRADCGQEDSVCYRVVRVSLVN